MIVMKNKIKLRVYIRIFMANCKVTTDIVIWWARFDYILKDRGSRQKGRFNSTFVIVVQGTRVTSTYVRQLNGVHTRGQLRRLTSNAGHSYAVLWGNSRWEAEVECNMPVVMVDHVCEDGYAGDCENNSENLSDCRADGDAALTDHWKWTIKWFKYEIKWFKTLFTFSFRI